jgi:5-methylcytosine-specific restriction endonuclease McrA
MCVSNNNVKYCKKHDCSYVQRGSSNRTHCRECTNERNRNTVRSQKAKENKKEIDRKYQKKKRLENPDVLKLAQKKYRISEKGKEKLNYYKFKFNQGKYCNLYCLECNEVRLHGDKICDKCKVSKRYISAYNYISLYKHCNNEFGIDVKLNNLGLVAQLNKYCSVECNKELRKITKKKNTIIHRRKYNNKYKRIRDDRQWAKKYGNEYKPINRSIVYRQHNYICTSCGVKCVHPNADNYNQSNAATLDHIIPKSKGGSHTYDNVTLLCRLCNTIKGAKIPTDYKRNISQIEIEFTGYIPQGSQLQLQLA